VEALRPRLDRIEVVTADVVDWLGRQDPASVDRFSLSDVPSYLDGGGYRALWEAVLHAAAPSARICVRQFLTRHELPDDLRVRVARDRALEDELARLDHAFAYAFVVATPVAA
jgi:S-adenosylmethionine-diacylglycerol 3-amino-3-carboxypropyl transferase